MSFNVSRTITYLVAVFVFSLTLFFVNASQANACSVNTANIRTSAAPAAPRVDLSSNSNWYSDDNQPFVYLDIQTTDCIEEGQLKITVAGLRGTSGDAQNNGSLVVDSLHIVNTDDIESNGDFTLVLRPTEKVCYTHNHPDCLILFFIRKNDNSIIRIIGNIASRMTLEEAGSFINTVTLGELPANSQPSNTTGNDCYGMSIGTSVGYYFQQATFTCPGAQWSFDSSGIYKDYSSSALFSFFFGSIDQRIHQYNTQILGLNLEFPEWSLGNFSRYRVAFPGLLFECDNSCDFFDPPWTSLGILPLGQVHPDDAGAVPVSGLPENYELEYAPLAPLPFPGLDGGSTPNLATYLQGIFRMLLIVAVVLSVVMIVIAGFQYVASSANPQGKGEARKRLSGALIGLVLALGSWLLLDTVNPNFASNLSISIPMVSLDPDAPDPNFQGSQTSSGTRLCEKGNHRLDNQDIFFGITAWPNDALNRSTLQNAGIEINTSANCAGTNYPSSCTSLYFNSGNSVIQTVINLKQVCDNASDSPCNITLTGGSECWLHSSHGPERRVVDIRSNDPTFNAWVVENATNVQSTRTSRDTNPNSTGFPNDGKNYIIPGIGSFKAEYAGQYSQTSGEHWHVVFQ
jgi:hypothetical protein